MIYYILLTFSIDCGIPCYPIETDYTLRYFNECRTERRAIMHRYLMEHNKLVWVVCRRVSDE